MPPKKRSHIGRHTAAAAAKKANRSAINASAVAAQRASEDPQQRATRLATNAAVASYDAASTASDGPETRSKRNAINASAVAAQRASEDPQQRATRLATNAAVASYDAASTASDGPETRSKRSAIKASAVAAQRASEDSQQRATRLATNAAATAASTFSTHSHDSDQQRSTFQRNSRRRVYIQNGVHIYVQLAFRSSDLETDIIDKYYSLNTEQDILISKTVDLNVLKEN
ncbi:Hypothetical predicted protein [Octopus vulgaris]|uniref:Uncharacterized protein n=1 Tax=Octopus vulgaris TaxID=6645 RepID=A0AA36BP62_OCTVU|nr:Hypothetical predicted protein [Octopus vulgaris]